MISSKSYDLAHFFSFIYYYCRFLIDDGTDLRAGDLGPAGRSVQPRVTMNFQKGQGRVWKVQGLYWLFALRTI